MKTNKYIFLLMLCFIGSLSCKTKNGNQAIGKDSNTNEVSEIARGDSTDLIFQDSLTINKNNQYKFEVTQTYVSKGDIKSLLRISLFKKNNSDWTHLQTSTDTLVEVQNTDVELRDINNDGLLDLNFVYALAGRGYNDLRKHYILDNKQSRLVAIKNSPQYPNLTYNENLDCIESHIGHGGYTTVFLQLEADSLREFASIDLYDNERIVSVADKNGQKNIIDKKPYRLDNEDADMTYGDYDIRLLKQYKNK